MPANWTAVNDPGQGLVTFLGGRTLSQCFGEEPK